MVLAMRSAPPGSAERTSARQRLCARANPLGTIRAAEAKGQRAWTWSKSRVWSFRGSSPDRVPGAPRLRGAPRARAIDGSRLRADRPHVSPSGDLAAEAPRAQRNDDQATPRAGGTGSRSAPGLDSEQRRDAPDHT